jgi:hypothetical protein
MVLLFQPVIYWCLIGFLAGAILISLVGAFVSFMDARLG